MERTKLSRIAPLALLALLVLPLLLAVPPAGAHGRPPSAVQGSPAERLENRLLTLGLDDPTRKQVFAILDGARPENRELRVQIRSAQQALGELMKKDEPAEAAVLKQIDEIGKLMTDLRKKELATLLAVRAKLTPEQRGKLRAELRPERAPLPDKPQGGCDKRPHGAKTISLGFAPL